MRYVSKAIVLKCCLMLSVFVLPACSYFGDEEVEVVQSVDLTVAEPEPVVLPNVEDIILRQSDGRVALYNLDQPIISGTGVVPTQKASAQPVNISSDPSVEIYSFDGSVPMNMPAVNPAHVHREPITRDVLSSSSHAAPYSVSTNISAAGSDVVILFDHGSALLDAGDLDIIDAVGRNYNGGMLTVTGHTSIDSTIYDPLKRKVSNLKLSMDRALRVAKALFDAGVPPDGVKVSGVGEAQASQSGISSEGSRKVTIKRGS